MSAVLSIENPRVVIGDNNPPADPTPFDLSKAEIDGLVMEAKHWLDGSGVHTEADATAISKLLDMIRKAEKLADERRTTENKPFDDGKAAVQARYAPLIGNTKSGKGKTVLAAEACKAALAPYLKRLDDEKRAIAVEARRKADADAAAAVEAMRAARQGSPDLEAREQAEALLERAKQAEADAKRAEGAKAHATGGTRAIGLRTEWRGEITDAREFAKWVWGNRHDELLGFMSAIVKSEVAAGKRSLPGVAITEEKVL